MNHPNLLFAATFSLVVKCCCGIDSYTDYNSVSSWRRTRYLTIEGRSLVYNLTTPMTCCKTSGDFPSVSFPDTACATTPTDLNNNWKTGCWSEVGDFLAKYRKPILAGVIIAIIIEVVFIVMAAIVCCLASPKVGNSDHA